jgi:translocation and assembly module TamB
MRIGSPDEQAAPSAVPARRRGWLFAAGAIGAIGAALWFLRAPLADNIVEDQLDSRGVRASYRIEAIGPRTQTLTDVVIGDPARPDLIARRVEVDLGWRWSGPVVSAIRADGVRLHGRWVDGRVSLGEVDKLLPPPTDEPFAFPDIAVSLDDVRARLVTPWGDFGARLDGSGLLRQNFRGKIAVVTDKLAAASCGTGKATAFGDIRIESGRPRFMGPVRVEQLICTNGARVARADVAVETRLTEDFRQWSGKLDLAVLGAGVRGGRVERIGGTMDFAGNAAAAKADFALAGTTARIDDAIIGTLNLNGNAVVGPQPGGQAKLTFADARLPARYHSALRQTGLDAGPLTPILQQILGSAAGAANGVLTGEAQLALVNQSGTRRLDVIAPQLRSASGAQVSGDARSRVSILFAETGPLALIDGRWRLAGGGLPGADMTLLRRRDGSLTGRATFAPVTAGTARLAVSPVTITGDRTGAMRLATKVALSGPVAGGRVDGLTMALTGTLRANGDFALAGGCQPVTLERAVLGGFQLGRNALQLCAAPGAPLLAYRAGRLTGEVRVANPVIAGRSGANPVQLRAARLRYALATGALRIDDLTAAIGTGDAATNFSAAAIRGQASGAAFAGQVDGARGEIGTIPLLMSKIAGDWRWADGALTLNGGLEVSDTAVPPRFYPLVSRDAALRFADGRITATAAFAELVKDAPVGRAVIAHDFASAAGSADLIVDGLRFTQGFQPRDLSPLTLGVIANARATVGGRGQVRWTADGVTSNGSFTTAGSDFAAAFGSVSGATTTINFDDLIGLHTPPGQRISVDQINPGFPVLGGLIDYQLLDANRIRIEGGRWPFAGGELRLKPTTLDFDVSAVRRLEFELSGVDAAVFLSELGFQNINASGVFDGILPVEFSGLGGRIVGGRLVARPGGGEVAYVGELTNRDLGIFANYAFNTLKSLSYDDMVIGLNGDLDGEMLTDVKIIGLGQGAGADRNIITRQIEKLPIVFNVRVNAPFRQLISSAKSLYDPTVLIDQNLFALIEAQRKAATPVVQPPESEPVQ